MKPELDEALCTKYPEIFRDRNGDMRTTAMCWGFECGDGWYDLLDTLCQELMDLSKEVDPPHIPVATQVKEKYGTLRFYINGGTDAQWDAISRAGDRSGKTCEACGKPGKVTGSGWFYSACPEHTDPDDLELDNYT